MVAHDSGDIDPLRSAVEAAHEAGLSKDDIQKAEQLLREMEEKEQPLTFTDVSRSDIEQLQAATSRNHAVGVLMQCMGLSLDDGFQSEILAEFHYHNFAFCQRNGFSAEKTSTLLSLFKQVHSQAIARGKGVSQAQARGLFEDLLEKHSLQLPPFSVGVFSADEAGAVRNYADKSFFHHYKMYAFAYSRRMDLSVRARTERVVPPTATAAAIHRRCELDPHQVPELEDLFRDPDSQAPVALTLGRGSPLPERWSPHPPEEEKITDEDHILKAIDSAMQGHFSALDDRMKLPEKSQ